MGDRTKELVKFLKNADIPSFTSIEKTSLIEDGGSSAAEEYERIQNNKTKSSRILMMNDRILSDGLFNNTKLGVIENVIKKPLPDEFFFFVKYRRSTRNLLIAKNEDMFLIWGQNGLLALVVILTYLSVWLFQLGKFKKSIVKMFILLQRMLL